MSAATSVAATPPIILRVDADEAWRGCERCLCCGDPLKEIAVAHDAAGRGPTDRVDDPRRLMRKKKICKPTRSTANDKSLPSARRWLRAVRRHAPARLLRLPGAAPAGRCRQDEGGPEGRRVTVVSQPNTSATKLAGGDSVRRRLSSIFERPSSGRERCGVDRDRLHRADPESMAATASRHVPSDAGARQRRRSAPGTLR